MADLSENNMCEGEQNYDPIPVLAARILSGNFPIIVKLILSYLPAKSLNTAARVCKQWRQLVSEIRNGRHDLSWFMYIPDQEEDEDIPDHGLADRLASYFKSLWCEPDTVLGFFTTDLHEEKLVLPNMNSPVSGRSRRAKCSYVDIEDYITNALPKTCKFVGVAADGAVGTGWRSPKSVECESKRALTLLSLPHIEGMEIFPFTMNMYSERWLESMDYAPTFEVDIATISKIPPDKKVKAVLFFCDEQYCPPEMGYSILRQYTEAVMAGGYIDRLVLPPHLTHGDSNPGILCVAFCGENLKVASVLIRESVKTAEEAEKQIAKLKDCKLSEDKSFAFIFACVGRGEGLYKKSNVESDAFRKVFPRTPLFGVFGNGEVGYNSFPDSNGDTRKVQTPKSPSKHILPKLYHAYTTVVCLFSVQ